MTKSAPTNQCRVMPWVKIDGQWVNQDSERALTERGGVLKISRFVTQAAIDLLPADDPGYEERLAFLKNGLFYVEDSLRFIKYDHTGLRFSPVEVAKPVIFTQEHDPEKLDQTFDGNLSWVDAKGEVWAVNLHEIVEPFDITDEYARFWSPKSIHDFIQRRIGSLPQLSAFYGNVPGAAYPSLSGIYAIGQLQDEIFYFYGDLGTKEAIGAGSDLVLMSYILNGAIRLVTYTGQNVKVFPYQTDFVRSMATVAGIVTLRANTRYHIDHDKGCKLPALDRAIAGEEVKLANITDQDITIHRNDDSPISNTLRETDDTVLVAPGVAVTFWLEPGIGWWFEEIKGRVFLGRNKPVTNLPPIISYEGLPFPVVTETNTLWAGEIILTVTDPAIS